MFRGLLAAVLGVVVSLLPLLSSNVREWLSEKLEERRRRRRRQ